MPFKSGNPGCACCDGACTWSICVRDCDGGLIDLFGFHFSKVGTGDGFVGVFDAQTPNPTCLTDFRIGGLTSGEWLVTITPHGPWAEFFAPTTIGFTVECPGHVALEVSPALKAGYTCDCSCDGMPTPAPGAGGLYCYELTDPLGNTFAVPGCRTYTPSDTVRKYCQPEEGECRQALPVPVNYLITGDSCTSVGLSISAPARLLRPVDWGPCSDLDQVIPKGCREDMWLLPRTLPGNWCYELWDLIGGMSCAKWTGSGIVQSCPTGSSPIEADFGAGVIVGFQLDCESWEDTISVAVPTGDPCHCYDGEVCTPGTPGCDYGLGNGTSGVAHPMTKLFGTGPWTFTLRRKPCP